MGHQEHGSEMVEAEVLSPEAMAWMARTSLEQSPPSPDKLTTIGASERLILMNKANDETMDLRTYYNGLKWYYDDVASDYEQMISDKEQLSSCVTKQVATLFLRHNITSGSVLDVGSGPGNLKSDLEGNFSFTGIDFSTKMLELAEMKGYEIIEGNIKDILCKLGTKSYDYVAALGCLLFQPDIEFILEQISRIAIKAWVVTLDDVTGRYAQNGPKIFNHAQVEVPGATEDFCFDAWKLAGEQVVCRLVFKQLAGANCT